jgi:hypothetical protein
MADRRRPNKIARAGTGACMVLCIVGVNDLLANCILSPYRK